MGYQRRNKPDEEPPSVEEVQAIFRRAREREPESTEALVERAGREPLGIDISDYSDEWCAGFLAGQANGVAELTERLAAQENLLDLASEMRHDLEERLAAAERERDEAVKWHSERLSKLSAACVTAEARVKVLEEQLEAYEKALREIAYRPYEGSGAKKWWASSEVREVALNALLPAATRFQCQVGPGCENATPSGPCCGIPASFPATKAALSQVREP